MTILCILLISMFCNCLCLFVVLVRQYLKLIMKPRAALNNPFFLSHPLLPSFISFLPLSIYPSLSHTSIYLSIYFCLYLFFYLHFSLYLYQSIYLSFLNLFYIYLFIIIFLHSLSIYLLYLSKIQGFKGFKISQPCFCLIQTSQTGSKQQMNQTC